MDSAQELDTGDTQVVMAQLAEGMKEIDRLEIALLGQDTGELAYGLEQDLLGVDKLSGEAQI
jgi:hypothetical protein